MQEDIILLAFFCYCDIMFSELFYKGVIMKTIITKGLKLFGLSIIANIMCIILIMSFSVLATGLFTETIGYTVYGIKEGDTEQTELYTHYNADGEDTKKAEFEEQGYKLSEMSIRSEPSKASMAVWNVITQLFCLMLMISFIYNELWKIGSKDSNLVKFKAEKEDKLKGLKAGLVASAPAYILLIALAVLKGGITKNIPVAIFTFLNAYMHTSLDLIAADVLVFGDLAVWQLLLFAVCISVLPVTAWLSYLLGYKNFSIGEKLVYKKQK